MFHLFLVRCFFTDLIKEDTTTALMSRSLERGKACRQKIAAESQSNTKCWCYAKPGDGNVALFYLSSESYTWARNSAWTPTNVLPIVGWEGSMPYLSAVLAESRLNSEGALSHDMVSRMLLECRILQQHKFIKFAQTTREPALFSRCEDCTSIFNIF